MRYIATPPTSCLSCDAGTFIADEQGYFHLEAESGAAAAFAAQGITLAPHEDDVAAQEAERIAAEEADRIAAEEAALAAQMAADADKQRAFDEAVERRVAERLAAEGAKPAKAKTTAAPKAE